MNDNISKFDLKAKILSNIEIAESHFQIQLACSEIAATARPGQFIHLLIDQRYEPLLRRPFTIYRAENGIIEIIFQVIGRGTRLLSQKRPGDEVRVMGPLGNSFVIPEKLDTAILIGGGIGIASLVMLAEELKRKKRCSIGLVGAQNCRQILCVDDLQAVGTEVYVSTDDGSCGYHGLVTELLRKILLNYASRITH
ncbi:TPA: dihydroorotate dehydrogenase electron transfer subunit, partial [Candidatus Poribacteria bacterium]|nr:dihydroorotate dehydrogenase electron transfer subunit [Candidatus Poribacteria bacterium]